MYKISGCVAIKILRCGLEAKQAQNLSPYYSMMLLAETFVRLLQKWDGGQLNAIEPDLVCNRVPQVLIQLVNRKLLSQKSDGTWGPEVCPERDAYAILTLLATTSLPHVRAFELKIQSAIHSGRHALLQCESQWAEPQYLWIEKVIYGSSALAETYCISAMNAKFGTHQWTDRFEKIAGSHSRNIMRLSKFFSSLPTLRKEPSWKILVSVVEGFSFLPQLLDARSKIFPRRQSAEDKYLEYIPCTWIVINNCDALCLEPFVLWDMMVMSMLDFLVDEYMESTVAKLSEIGLHLLCSRIPALCKSAKTEASGKVDQTVERSAHLNHQEKRFGPISAIETVLKNYIGKGLDHPRIQNASSQNKLSLQAELQTFLLSHLEKIHDNIQLRQQQPQPQPQDLTTCFLSPRSSHYVWSHTTAAYHTSCALSFNFYICLLKASSPRYSDFFERADEKYLAQDLCAHLGTMTRLYNDYGSIVRDRTEVNLNSTNFPEFHLDHSIDRMEPAHIADTTRKKTLLSLAEYEKRQAQAALQSSTDLLGGRKGGEKMAGALRVFARVTELYADMYVVRDLTNRVK